MSAYSASGTFTATGVSEQQNHSGGGYLALSISGTFAATIDLERSIDGGVTYTVVESYTAATEVNVHTVSQSIQYRLNCSAYTSGSAVYFLGYP